MHSSVCHLAASCPDRFGSDFSGLQLPEGVEPRMIQEFVKLIRLDQHGVYPYEIVFHVHVTERGWFPYMVSDICCVETLMFSTRYFFALDGSSTTKDHARLHHIRALRLLQRRLNNSDLSAAISDTTIIAITMLAGAAEVMGDVPAMSKHLSGLETIVKLRGGVGALDQRKNIQVKVCKIDLTYAILSGTEPNFLWNDFSWDCLLADHDLLKKAQSREINSELWNLFINDFDTRLVNIHKDLQAFSTLSNLAYQTTRKLSPELYNEVMISVFYRLLHLRCSNDSIQEVLRLGLLVMCSTIFLQPALVQKPYHRLINEFNTALYSIVDRGQIPTTLAFWLVMLAHLIADGEISPTDWRTLWLRKIIIAGGVESWPAARQMLGLVFWVDFVHGKRGKVVFHRAMK